MPSLFEETTRRLQQAHFGPVRFGGSGQTRPDTSQGMILHSAGQLPAMRAEESQRRGLHQRLVQQELRLQGHMNEIKMLSKQNKIITVSQPPALFNIGHSPRKQSNLVYTFVQRSFAPWSKFGDLAGWFQQSFLGDKRGFSLLPSSTDRRKGFVTARIQQFTQVDLDGNILLPALTKRRYASRTVGNLNFLGRERGAYATVHGKESFSKNGELTMHMYGSDPLVNVLAIGDTVYESTPTLAPNIDWDNTTTIDIVESGGQQYLNVRTIIKGKGFPAYEFFVRDRSTNAVFIHTYAAPNRLDLGRQLAIPGYDYIKSISLNIPIDSSGLFILNGQMSVSESNDYHTYKTYKVNEWNTINTRKKVAPDLNRMDL